MIRSKLDRVVIRVILGVLIVALAIFGWISYGRYLRHSLIQAARAGDTARLQALLARGVDPNAEEDDPDPIDPQVKGRYTAVEWALKSPHPEAAAILLRKGAKADTNAIFLATKEHDPRPALALIDCGVDRRKVLESAASNGNAPVVRTLLERYPALKEAMESKAMLANAAGNGNVALIKVLLDSGAQVDARDDTGATPLMRAAMEGSKQAAAFLLSHGADVNATTPKGRSAGYFADLTQHAEVADLLAGARGHAGSATAQSSLKALHQRASTLYYQGNLEDAMATWRQIIARFPADVDARLYLGRALWHRGQFEAATAVVGQAVRLAPRSARVHVYRGSLLFRQHKLNAAIAEYHTALRLNPHEFMAHQSLADALDQQGKHAASIAENRVLVAQNPANATAHYALGSRLDRRGHAAEAILECRRAVEMNPQFGEAWVSLGWMLMMQGRIPEAVEACQRAIVLRPTDANAHANLGRALTAQGKLKEAVVECQHALQLDPSDAEAHYNLGLALEKQGQRAEATTELQTYVREAQQNPGERERIADARTHLRQWGANP
jgi:tetratricopeptide (TPR) repeat protein